MGYESEKTIGYDWYRADSYIYFVSTDTNAIVKGNVNSGKSKVLGVFPELELHRGDASYSCACVEDKLFFSAGCSNYLAVVNIQDDTVIFLSIKEYIRGYTGNQERKFWKMCVCGNNIYVVGLGCPIVLKVNVDSYEIEPIILEKTYDSLETNKDYLASGYFIHDGYLFVSQFYKNVLIRIRLSDNNVERISIKGIEVGLHIKGIIGYKDDIWIVAENEDKCEIYVWNILERNIKKTITMPKDEFSESFSGENFSEPYLDGNYMYIFQYTGAYVFKINMENSTMTKVFVEGLENQMIAGAKINYPFIEFVIIYRKEFCVMNFYDRNLRVEQYHYDSNYQKDLDKSRYKYKMLNGYINEDTFTLRNYINCI